MNKWLRIAMTLWALACPTSAGASECASLSVARWVLGDWVTGGEKTVFHEWWTEVGSRAFEGMGSERSMANSRMVVAVSDGKDKGSTLNFKRGAAAADPGAPVLAAEDARFAAMIGGNAAELDQWLADDLQYVHSTGQVESREQFLASIAGGAFRYLEIAPLERQVVTLGDNSALVRGHARFQVIAGGNRLDLEIRYLAIYGLGSDGHWRLRAWQSLRLPQQSG